jgi:hypothetical protein
MSVTGDARKFMGFLGGGGIGQGNMQGLLGMAGRQARFGAQRSAATDIFQLNQRGLGRSTSAAFAPGMRMHQGNIGLLNFRRRLAVDDAKMRQQAGLGSLQLAMQNQGPGLMELLGGMLGAGTQVGTAALLRG